MLKTVVIKAFEKAKSDISGRSNKTNRASHISDILLNEYKYQLSGRSLRNLYDESNTVESNADISINSSHIQYLCKYLGYENYEAFMIDNPEETGIKNNMLGFIQKHKIVLLISIIVVIILSITTFNTQRWMVWQGDHYIEVKFDTEKYNIGQLKLYKEERIKDFKKIIPTCDTAFFNDDETVKIWYGKNTKKELEYFTSIGLHPETGKTLKPITTYMIKKHICESY